jgi:hypothetical protein
MKIEIPEIRDLIQGYYISAGWSNTEAARKAGMAPSALQRLVEGSLGLSPKTFNRIVKGWGIAKDAALLQGWLAALLVDRLGIDAKEWIQKVGWLPSEVPESAVEAPAFESYAALGETTVKAKRRLSILRRLCVAGEGGGTLAEMRSAARETANVVELDLKFLSEGGYIESWTSRATLRHPMQGTFQQAKRRATLRNWKVTQAGRRIVAAMEGLSDVTEKQTG